MASFVNWWAILLHYETQAGRIIIDILETWINILAIDN